MSSLGGPTSKKKSLVLDQGSGQSFKWPMLLTQEVDQFLVSRRTVVLSSFLLQRLLKDLLQHLGGVVVVERHVGHHVVLVQLGQLLVDLAKKWRVLNSWLSRLSTARGLNKRLLQLGFTKVKACKS